MNIVPRQIAIAFPCTLGYHHEVIQGIVEWSKEHGPWVFLSAPETAEMSVLDLKGWRGDGIIANIDTQREARMAHRFPIPVVNLSGVLAHPGLPSVMNDHAAMGRLAAEHLLNCGIQRFAYYGLQDVWYSQERGRGFMERLHQAGYACEILETSSEFARTERWHRWLEELHRWLQKMRPPLGLLAVHDNRARMVIAACQRLGLVVPHDVAVIGVDDEQPTCEMSRPTLTSVARNGREIGYRAAELLDRLWSHRRPARTTIVVPLVGVVPRESTDMVAVNDPALNLAVRWIRERLTQPFTIKDLLRKLAVSRRWLEYRFRQRLGRSPHQYIMEARMERAKRLLVEAKRPSLESIAKACGLSGVRNLRDAFQRFTGMAPLEFRRTRLAPTQASAPGTRKQRHRTQRKGKKSGGRSHGCRRSQ